MTIPNTYTNINETGCCAIPNIGDWDKKSITFKDRHFIRMYTKSFLHIPLNMAKIMKLLNESASSAKVNLPPEQAIILSRDLSAWKAEQLYGVSEPIKGMDNVTINGKFLSMAFEGPYQNARIWLDELLNYAKQQNYKTSDIYFFYTTCPKCAKHYGKNYIIGLAKVTS